MRPLETMPDAHSYFGPYGGMFVPETLMTALEELTAKYERARVDPNFQRELDTLLHDFAGPPTPLYYAERLTDRCHERRFDKDVAIASNPKSKT